MRSRCPVGRSRRHGLSELLAQQTRQEIGKPFEEFQGGFMLYGHRHGAGPVAHGGPSRRQATRSGSDSPWRMPLTLPRLARGVPRRCPEQFGRGAECDCDRSAPGDHLLHPLQAYCCSVRLHRVYLPALV